MPITSPVQRLQRLNRLLFALHPKESEEAEEIRKAVEFFIAEVQNITTPIVFSDFAKEILSIHTRSDNSQHIGFWSVSVKDSEPLWLRSAFLNQLQALEKFNPATLVIYGLQDSVVKDEKYWTEKLEQRYHSVRDYLEEVAADWQSPNRTLNLIYI